MIFFLRIDKRAINDIQQAIDYDDDKQYGSGDDFYHEVNEIVNALIINPYYQSVIRRCGAFL